jgi:hypothetical protein
LLLLTHVGHDHAERRDTERFHQGRMLSVEIAEAVDDGVIMLLG